MPPEIKQFGAHLMSLAHAGERHMEQASRRVLSDTGAAVRLLNRASADFRTLYTNLDGIQDSATAFAGPETGETLRDTKRLALHEQTVALVYGDRLTPIVKHKARQRGHKDL